MIEAVRLSTTHVSFTDLDSETGFVSELTQAVFSRLVHKSMIGLSLEACIKLYWLMCKYRTIYIKEGKLFEKIRVHKDRHEYYVLPTSKFTEEEQLERQLDSYIEAIDELTGEPKHKAITGTRYDR